MKRKKSDSTYTLSVVLPVVDADDADGNPIPWEKLNQILNPTFRFVTDLANWAVQTLFKKDTVNVYSTPNAVKPGLKSETDKCYLYGEAVRAYPDWKEKTKDFSSSAAEVIHNVHWKYMEDRFDILFRHESRLTTYQYPYPIPFNNQRWSLDKDERSGWYVAVIGLPGHPRIRLRLQQGTEFRRQLALLRQIETGVAKVGAAAIYRNNKGRLMFKAVGNFPKVKREGATNVCFLHTDPNALLVAEVNGRRVTVTNADHLKRAMKVFTHYADKHRRFLQRSSEDKKREVRMNRNHRKNFNTYIDGRCEKQNNRMDTALKQIAAQISRFCERQRVGLIAYDDSIRSFLPDGFRWFDLKDYIRTVFTGRMGGEWIDADGTGGPYTKADSDEGREERQQWLTEAKQRIEAETATTKRVVAHGQRKGSHPAVTPPTDSMSLQKVNG